RFRVEGLFSWYWELQVRSEGLLPWEGFLEPGQKEIRIVLQSGFPLEGLVLDWLGAPAGGAEVRLQPEESSLPFPARSTRTDARGRFRMANLGTMARARLLVHAAGNAVTVLEKVVVHPGMAPLVVRLEKGLVLAGQVQDGRDEPVASVSVSIRGPRLLAENRIPARTGESVFGLERMQTGEDGRFRFRDLYAGEFTVKAAPQGNRPGASAIAAAGEEGLVLILGVEPGSTVVFFGQARNAETGAPVPGASITVMQVRRMGAHSWGARGVAMALSGKDGSFEVNPVEPGELYVWITAKGFSSWENERAEVEAGRHFLSADLHPARTLLVKVVDAGGQPVKGISLEVLDPDGKQLSITVSQGGSSTQVRTDPGGLAGLAGLPALPVTVRVSDLGILLGRFDFDLTRPIHGTRELRLPIFFQRPRRLFTVQLLEKTGGGAARPLKTACTVRAFNEEGLLVGQAGSLPDRTDPGAEPSPSAAVSLSLPREPCRLEITAAGFQPAGAWAGKEEGIAEIHLSR
ncbi:MAG: collagen binding domain-containing protein, partial [Planctomycetota bacterium]